MKRLTPFVFIFFFFLNLSKASEVAPPVFIVNSANPNSKLSVLDLADYYLKKKRFWSNRTSVRFIDRPDNSPLREYFLKNVLKQTSREIDLYWIGQKLATGNGAPLQVPADSLVASMVLNFPESIGYVGSNFALPPGVKKITIIENRPSGDE